MVIRAAFEADRKKGSSREQWRLGCGYKAGLMEPEERLDPGLQNAVRTSAERCRVMRVSLRDTWGLKDKFQV